MGSYKGRINYSYNIKKLNIVIKYTKSKGNKQKIYRGKDKQKLLNYIEKEGNIFKSKKDINKVGIKHIIVSPINPKLYNKLNDEQKQKVKEIVKDTLFNNFYRYGFVGGLEEKEREINGEKLDHFHVHIAINERYDIGLKQINYIKRQIEKGFLKDEELKQTLNLKTTKELKREKMLQIHLNKKIKENWDKIKNDWSEIKEINNDISQLFKFKKTKYLEKNELTRENFIYYNNIFEIKDILKQDIQQIKEIIDGKNKLIKNLEKNIEEIEEDQKRRETELTKDLTNTLRTYVNFLNIQTQEYFNYLNYTNTIYILYQKQLLKNKEITKEEFIQNVRNNRYYIKQQQQYYMEQKREQIKNKQKKLIENIKKTLKYYKNLKEYKYLSIKYLKQNIKIEYKSIEKLIKESNTDISKIKNKIELNNIKINLIRRELQRIKLETEYKLYTKLKIKQQIEKRKQENIKIKELKQKVRENKVDVNKIDINEIENYNYNNYLSM